ncbi:MAG: hypothetical protein QX191_01495, partial [Methylococcaceae bacterium]
NFNHKPTNVNRRPMNFNHKPTNVNRRPMNFNHKPTNVNRRPMNFNRSLKFIRNTTVDRISCAADNSHCT